MFYAQNTEDDKFSFFISFLQHIVDGDERFKIYVDSIIDEALAYAKKQKNLYDIDRDNFHLIIYLARKPDLPSKIEKTEDYKGILNYLQKNTLPYNYGI